MRDFTRSLRVGNRNGILRQGEMESPIQQFLNPLMPIMNKKQKEKRLKNLKVINIGTAKLEKLNQCRS